MPKVAATGLFDDAKPLPMLSTPARSRRGFSPFALPEVVILRQREAGARCFFEDGGTWDRARASGSWNGISTQRPQKRAAASAPSLEALPASGLASVAPVAPAAPCRFIPAGEKKDGCGGKVRGGSAAVRDVAMESKKAIASRPRLSGASVRMVPPAEFLTGRDRAKVQ